MVSAGAINLSRSILWRPRHGGWRMFLCRAWVLARRAFWNLWYS